MIKLIHPKTETVREVSVSRQNKIRILRRAGFVNFDSYKPKKKPKEVPDSTVSEIVQEHKLAGVDSTDAPEAVTAIHVSAAARTLIEENDLDPSLIEGTGKNGSIIKPDVVKHLKALEISDEELPEQPPEEVEKAMAEAVVRVATEEEEAEEEVLAEAESGLEVEEEDLPAEDILTHDDPEPEEEEETE